MEQILEQNKPLRLPRALNFGIITSEFTFPIAVGITHSDMLEPIITLSRVKENLTEEKLGGD